MTPRNPVPAPPWRRREVVLPALIAVIVVASLLGTGSLLLAESYLCLTLTALVVLTVRAARAHEVPEGALGVALPSALAAWLFGHLTELVVVWLHPEAMPVAPSDLAFSCRWVSSSSWRRGCGGTPPSTSKPAACCAAAWTR